MGVELIPHIESKIQPKTTGFPLIAGFLGVEADSPPKNAANRLPMRFCADFPSRTLRLNSPRSKAGGFPETPPNDAAAVVESIPPPPTPIEAEFAEKDRSCHISHEAG